jgi:23S rRNA (pseudouridine1915-N3)-methyltransferase
MSEYHKRIPKNYHVELIGIPLQNRPKSQEFKRMMEKEGQMMLQYIPDDALCIAMDIQGLPLSTELLSDHLKNWQLESKTVCIMIGGPEGLAPACYARATLKWSLSRLTFPHPLVPLLLLEQVYRAYTILIDHPYHK